MNIFSGIACLFLASVLSAQSLPEETQLGKTQLGQTNDPAAQSVNSPAAPQTAPAVPAPAAAPPVASADPLLTPPDKHVFGVLPNYRTADPTKAFRALSAKEKFTIAVHDSFDPPGFGIAAWYTMIYHLENTNPEFGQGAKGYFHRYGVTYADQMSGNMMTEGLMPSLLHEDPRYYRRIHGSIPVRAAWAVSRIFVTRTDSDKYDFNYSEFVGNSLSSLVANAYYPADRRLRDDVSRLETQIISDTISNELKEFWPDIKRVFHLGPIGHRKDKLPATP